MAAAATRSRAVDLSLSLLTQSRQLTFLLSEWMQAQITVDWQQE